MHDLLSIMLDALNCFEDTIKAGDRDWASYPAPTDDPDATLADYLKSIHAAQVVVSALMPPPDVEWRPKEARAAIKLLRDIAGLNGNTTT
jgi:hypothetical protein